MVLLILFFPGLNARGQDFCSLKDGIMPEGYVSDGQYHEFIIDSEISIKINTTFLKNMNYKIILCPDNLEKYEFVLKDREGKLLFRKDHLSGTFQWDFSFKSTVECIIEMKTENGRQQTNFKLYTGYKLP